MRDAVQDALPFKRRPSKDDRPADLVERTALFDGCDEAVAAKVTTCSSRGHAFREKSGECFAKL